MTRRRFADRPEGARSIFQYLAPAPATPRKPPHQQRQRHLRRLPSPHNRLHDIRRQQSQPQDATHVGPIDFLGGGDLRNGRVRAVLQ
jgi:hypothetical protein